MHNYMIKLDYQIFYLQILEGKCMKKLLSIVLCIILCSQMFVFGGANVFVSANTTDPFFASGVWTQEKPKNENEGFYVMIITSLLLCPLFQMVY